MPIINPNLGEQNLHNAIFFAQEFTKKNLMFLFFIGVDEAGTAQITSPHDISADTAIDSLNKLVAALNEGRKPQGIIKPLQ